MSELTVLKKFLICSFIFILFVNLAVMMHSIYLKDKNIKKIIELIQKVERIERELNRIKNDFVLFKKSKEKTIKKIDNKIKNKVKSWKIKR